jgi:hypothetical protein
MMGNYIRESFRATRSSQVCRRPVDPGYTRTIDARGEACYRASWGQSRGRAMIVDLFLSAVFDDSNENSIEALE